MKFNPNTIFIILILLLPLTCLSQKVKLKGEKVFVDKEHLYNLIEVDCSAKYSNLSCLSLTNLEGEAILNLIDTAYNFIQLPNEIEPRVSFFAYKIISLKDNTNGIIPNVPMHSRKKYRIKQLKKVGFFNSSKFDIKKYIENGTKQFTKVIPNEIDVRNKLNEEREKNYLVTKQKYGDLLKRVPGKISVKQTSNTIKIVEGESFEFETHNILDGKTIIGKIIFSLELSGSRSYNIIDSKGNKIARIRILNKIVKENLSEKYKYWVSPEIFNGEKIWFEHRLSKVNKNNISQNEQFTIISKYLINSGII